jgi:4-alpha-glucanotransferase
MPTSRSWGIGEIGDVAPMAAWMRRAGLRLLQLLPINEMAPGQKSPYSAISAMAIDPIFISLADLEDHVAEGGEAGVDAASRRLLAEVRRSREIDYAAVRALKNQALRAAFLRFLEAEWRRHTPRAEAFRLFLALHRWWLDDDALFRALHARAGERPWTEWGPGLREHAPAAVEAAARELADEVLYYQYLQWVADTQWKAARRAAGPVALFGDLPFMVDADSADVWANQALFDFSGTVGAPPDAFSEAGQNWGLPVYRWDVMEASGDEWLRQRARRSADLYAGYRIDHLVGFYRTYVFPKDGSKPHFTPADEEAQLALGERVLGIFADAGARVIAEDLGTVPTFVRASLGRLGIPGYRVLRWEREWEEPGRPFRDPRAYPRQSVATSGTHDTEPMAVWWNEAPEDERAELLHLPFIAARLAGPSEAAEIPYDASLRDTLLELLFASGSDLLILPIQDVFGWSDRVNVPASVSADNWTYRLPWPIDRLDEQPAARERRARVATWTKQYGR